jgi:hypothetical protein
MFDPTAFENMKVVLEGAIYDLDLNGEIVIIDRNDIINTAKLSREYELKFKLDHSSAVAASIEMESGLENLVAELLPGSLSQRKSGCSIRLYFSFEHQHKIVDYQKINKVLTDIWGSKRKIIHTVSFYPLQQDNMNSLITIEFGRLVHEDQIDDITAMIDFMFTTCEQLQNAIPRKK